MKKIDIDNIDYYILESIINSSYNNSDIIQMVQRFISIRFIFDSYKSSNIQYPRPVGDETDNIK